MHARALLTVTTVAGPDGLFRTRVSRLRSDGPVVLRSTIATGPALPRPWDDLDGPGTVHVSRVAGAAGPLGGDDLELRVDVEHGATLVLRDVAATLALPGPHGQRSRFHTTIRVAADATLVWLPEPLIAARGCDHHATTDVVLDRGARLLLREELLLGRHEETPGAVRQQLRVCLADQPLHQQELAAGPDVPGWRGPAVTGGRRALGSLLVVDPACDTDQLTSPEGSPSGMAPVDVALLPLSGPAVLVTALAEDGLTLRRHLDTSLAQLCGLARRA